MGMKTVKQMTEQAVKEFKSSMNSAAIKEIVKLRRKVIRTERMAESYREGNMTNFQRLGDEWKAHKATKQEHEESLADKQKAHEEEMAEFNRLHKEQAEAIEKQHKKELQGREFMLQEAENKAFDYSCVIKSLAGTQKELLTRITDLVHEEA